MESERIEIISKLEYSNLNENSKKEYLEGYTYEENNHSIGLAGIKQNFQHPLFRNVNFNEIIQHFETSYNYFDESSINNLYKLSKFIVKNVRFSKTEQMERLVKKIQSNPHGYITIDDPIFQTFGINNKTYLKMFLND